MLLVRVQVFVELGQIHADHLPLMCQPPDYVDGLSSSESVPKSGASLSGKFGVDGIDVERQVERVLVVGI